MTTPEPNVVPQDAALDARSFVFEHRDTGQLEHVEVIDRMLAEGHGSEFPTSVRRKRLKTWSLQVLRRLKKRGWLEGSGKDGWTPTAALRSCRDSRAIGKPVRSKPRVEESPGAPSPEFWTSLIQDWVFHHRESEFGVAEVAVAVVQGGYGAGNIGDRLDGARAIVEAQLHSLEMGGLLEFNDQSELWTPTELLTDWPEAD
jgi:hypothetical protein